MSTLDRLIGPLRAIAARSDPLAPYRGLYRARVLAQSADLLRVDVQPEDPLLPPMSNIPLRTGIPGITVSVTGGCGVLVGWENGPEHPFCGLWSSPHDTGARDARGDSALPGGLVLSIGINGLIISLGSAELLPGLNGVLTGESIDPFTGVPHAALGNASPFVLARNRGA